MLAVFLSTGSRQVCELNSIVVVVIGVVVVRKTLRFASRSDSEAARLNLTYILSAQKLPTLSQNLRFVLLIN